MDAMPQWPGGLPKMKERTVHTTEWQQFNLYYVCVQTFSFGYFALAALSFSVSPALFNCNQPKSQRIQRCVCVPVYFMFHVVAQSKVCAQTLGRSKPSSRIWHYSKIYWSIRVVYPRRCASLPRSHSVHIFRLLSISLQWNFQSNLFVLAALHIGSMNW